jgi:hypothetical protein
LKLETENKTKAAKIKQQEEELAAITKSIDD